MALIQIDHIEVGMTLKSDVCDRSGRLLLPAGVELGEKHLKIFRTWGISEADIQRGPDDEADDAGAADSAVDPALLAEAEQAVAPMFHLNDLQHPMIHELMKVCVLRRLAGGR